MLKLSNLFIPLVVLLIIIYALKKRVDIYDSFLKGAKEGIDLAFSILPCLIAMLFAINVLTSSNFITDFFSIFKPVLNLLEVPIEIVPMIITRPISGNASFAIMIDLIKTSGADSLVGTLASILQGSTDTTIYVLSLYFGSVGIRNIKYALKAGLFADFIAVLFSILIVNIFLF